MSHCPLCNSSKGSQLSPQFISCSTCSGIYRLKEFHPSEKEEHERYLTHRNDADDPEYRKFVSPVTEAISKNFNRLHQGLDFGSGISSPITKVLSDKGYRIKEYDLYFHPKPELLELKYDYIACCEVAEHFRNPADEFRLLRKMINKDGKLFLMTILYDDSIAFDSWWYTRDLTHLFFYRKETMDWIKKTFKFTSVSCEKRLMILEA